MSCSRKAAVRAVRLGLSPPGPEAQCCSVSARTGISARKIWTPSVEPWQRAAPAIVRARTASSDGRRLLGSGNPRTKSSGRRLRASAASSPCLSSRRSTQSKLGHQDVAAKTSHTTCSSSCCSGVPTTGSSSVPGMRISMTHCRRLTGPCSPERRFRQARAAKITHLWKGRGARCSGLDVGHDHHGYLGLRRVLCRPG